MSSSTLHSRTQSAFPTPEPSRTPHPLSRPVTSYESTDTAYNGCQLSAPAPAITPARQDFSTRFLSTISNAQPAAATLARKSSVLHSRAKSWVPKLNNNSNDSTPERPNTNRLFGDLFSGESAPVRLGAPVSPTKEVEENDLFMDYKPSLTARSSSSTFARPATASSRMNPPQTSRASSWFGRKSASTSTPLKPAQDDLAHLNINAALFPHGPESADHTNPHAFNYLLINATALLNRMQSAYKEKADFINSIQPEIDAQREEVEEADTRSRHLKMQLEDLSRKAQEQDTVMREMARQLAEEKLRTQEARDAAKTIRMVPQPHDAQPQAETHENTPRRRSSSRRKRGSAGSSASDSGFESDAGDAESVLSPSCGTPTGPATPAIALSPSPDYDGSSWGERELQPPAPVRGAQTGYPERRTTAVWGGKGEGAANAALQAENRELRRRVEEMGREVQGVIELVSGVRI